ncbi:hypothetical protein Vadar_009113 [Vaccinium darrowii]|uniref:Uncharacterized protein n=1 Tax=Vaccinium darrowii TaxID=229202 RepID=A0ACB7YVZ8_9ERIC|nr:hypothetical protein Vadar_009113 [Vaccinium darrowii]
MMMDIALSVVLFFLAVALFVTIHVCIAGRALRRGGLDINATTGVVGRSGSRRPNMSLDDIRKLPSFGYKVEEEEGGKGSQMECAVCLENFKVGEMCRLLPNCQHSFHAQCIDSWLSKRAICPVCRTGAIPVNTGEQSRNLEETGVGSVSEAAVVVV